MTLIDPRFITWEAIPFDSSLSDESRAWLRRNSWGDYSLLSDVPHVSGRVDDSLSAYDSAPNPRS